jgi:hypothetical protein
MGMEERAEESRKRENVLYIKCRTPYIQRVAASFAAAIAKEYV